MSRYSVVEGAAVTAEDIGEAILLDRLVYPEEYCVTLEQCLAWFRRNSRIYTMVRDGETGRIVGYVNVSPVTDEYYEKILGGEFIDACLPPEFRPVSRAARELYRVMKEAADK